MNKIRSIQALNKRELENGISPEASWHADYRDTAFIYFGGLPSELSEGDIIIIFSQYGEPVFIKLARDKETGKSRGFGWLKYEDQRSTELAVDNLGGAKILGRVLHVDHARYKPRDDEDPEEGKVDWRSMLRMEGKSADAEESSGGEEGEEADVGRPMLEEERELAKLMREHDEDDPMKAFLIEEKKKEVKEARERYERKSRRDKDRHRHRKHRSRRDEGDEDEESRARDKREDTRRRDSPDTRDSRRRDRERRKSPGEEGSSKDPYAEERERRRREKEKERRLDDQDADADSTDRRKRRRERESSPDHRRERNEKRHNRERKRSRSRSP